MKRLFLLCWIGGWCGVLFALPVTPSLEKNPVFFGEPIVVQVPVTPAKELRADLPAEEKKFSLIRVEPAPQAIRIVLSVLEPGEHPTPVITLHNGGEQYEVASVNLTVKPNTTEDDTQLRNIKPPVRAYERDYTLLWVFGAILLLALLFFLFWRLSKRRRAVIASAPPEKSPYQVALDYRRRAERLLQEMDYERFADTITAGLRHYLELVKRRPFLEMTTSEVQRTLKKSYLPADDVGRIVSFLAEADRFKYADESFPSERFSAFLDEFSHLIDRMERLRSLSTTPEHP